MSSNSTSPSPGPIPSSSTVTVEAFGPLVASGLHVLSSYFQIDPSRLISILFATATLAAATRYCINTFYGFVLKHCICSAEIQFEDEIYNYIMFWMSQQTFTQKTSHFVAGTKTSSSLVYSYEDSDDEDNLRDEDKDQEMLGEGFHDYWARIMDREKAKPIFYTPSQGTHWFQFKGRWISFSRICQESKTSHYTRRYETLHLSSIGRSTAHLKDLISEAQELYVKRDSRRTIIYRGGWFGLDGVEWKRCMTRPHRKLSTVVLDQVSKDALINDLKEYLHPFTRTWYANRGIPYRRGYLLYGPPGTGKTSLCVALAALFKLNIYMVSLNSFGLTEEVLISLFGSLPARCIVLLEDIDTAGISRSREPAERLSTQTPDTEVLDDTKTSSKGGISLSALLNVIDGVASKEGRILMMTTNHIDQLDLALLRPGRIDMKVGFQNANRTTAHELFYSIYNRQDMQGKQDEKAYDMDLQSLASKFASDVPEGKISPAEIQGYLLKHKNKPHDAIDGAREWIDKVVGISVSETEK